MHRVGLGDKYGPSNERIDMMTTSTIQYGRI